MKKPARPDPDGLERQRQLLLRGASTGRLDLGDWRAIHAFLARTGAAPTDIYALTEQDLDEVRRRLQRRRTLLENCEDALDRLDESGLGALLSGVAIGAAVAILWHVTRGSARAAMPDAGPPAPSTLAGILVSLVPILFAVVCAGAAMCGSRPSNTGSPGDLDP